MLCTYIRDYSLWLSDAAAKTSTTKQQLDQMDYESDDDFELSLQSSIGKEQCFICGIPGLVDFWNIIENSILGIIHWADMSVTDTRDPRI